MASIKLSAILSDIRGFLQGCTYARNHYGLFMRKSAYPGYMRTPAQATDRDLFQSVTTVWNTLTEEQRQLWATAAAETPKKNCFGDTYFPDGFHLFISCNVNLLLVGLPQISEPVYNNDLSGITGFTLSWSPPPNTAFLIDFGTGGTTQNIRCTIAASPGLNLGINYCQNKYRKISIIPEGSGSQWNFWKEYRDRFGLPVSNTKIFVKIRIINSLSGISGLTLHNSIIIS